MRCFLSGIKWIFWQTGARYAGFRGLVLLTLANLSPKLAVWWARQQKDRDWQRVFAEYNDAVKGMRKAKL